MKVKIILSYLWLSLLMVGCSLEKKPALNSVFSNPGTYISPDKGVTVVIREDSNGETLNLTITDVEGGSTSTSGIPKDLLIMCWGKNSDLWSQHNPQSVDVFRRHPVEGQPHSEGLFYGYSKSWYETYKYKSELPPEFLKAIKEKAKK